MCAWIHVTLPASQRATIPKREKMKAKRKQKAETKNNRRRKDKDTVTRLRVPKKEPPISGLASDSAKAKQRILHPAAPASADDIDIGSLVVQSLPSVFHPKTCLPNYPSRSAGPPPSS